jgi:biotin operon repressor
MRLNRRKTDRLLLSITNTLDPDKTLTEILNLYKNIQAWKKTGYKIMAVRERGYCRDFEEIVA